MELHPKQVFVSFVPNGHYLTLFGPGNDFQPVTFRVLLAHHQRMVAAGFKRIIHACKKSMAVVMHE